MSLTVVQVANRGRGLELIHPHKLTIGDVFRWSPYDPNWKVAVEKNLNRWSDYNLPVKWLFSDMTKTITRPGCVEYKRCVKCESACIVPMDVSVCSQCTDSLEYNWYALG